MTGEKDANENIEILKLETKFLHEALDDKKTLVASKDSLLYVKDVIIKPKDVIIEKDIIIRSFLKSEILSVKHKLHCRGVIERFINLMMFSSKVESIKLMCDRLNLMDVHPALCVFRKSLSSCRFSYLMRTSRSYLLAGSLKSFHELFRSTLEAITYTIMEGLSWDQTSLPGQTYVTRHFWP